MYQSGRPSEVDKVKELLGQQKTQSDITTMEIHEAEILLNYIDELERTVVNLTAAIVDDQPGDVKRQNNEKRSCQGGM
jgi:hypothetical protein